MVNPIWLFRKLIDSSRIEIRIISIWSNMSLITRILLKNKNLNMNLRPPLLLMRSKSKKREELPKRITLKGCKKICFKVTKLSHTYEIKPTVEKIILSWWANYSCSSHRSKSSKVRMMILTFISTKLNSDTSQKKRRLVLNHIKS